jgi:hypothetical protein
MKEPIVRVEYLFSFINYKYLFQTKNETHFTILIFIKLKIKW